jgi:hypothetical protein
VTKAAVDHLIDARRQQPSTRRIPEPPPDFVTDDVALRTHGTPSNTPMETDVGAGDPPPAADDNPPAPDGSQITFEL